MKEELVEYQFLPQPKLASEIWEFGTNFSDLGLLFLLAKQPKIRFFPTSPANRGSLRRNQADSRPGAAALARLCAVARGCAWPRGGARSRAPPLAPAGGSTGRERENWREEI